MNPQHPLYQQYLLILKNHLFLMIVKIEKTQLLL